VKYNEVVLTMFWKGFLPCLKSSKGEEYRRLVLGWFFFSHLSLAHTEEIWMKTDDLSVTRRSGNSATKSLEQQIFTVIEKSNLYM